MEKDDILKSIKEEMEIKEKEFNQVVNELAMLEQNYSIKKTQLESTKEQIRGAYTMLYKQLEKFTSKSQGVETSKSTETLKQEEKIKSNSQTNTTKAKSTATINRQTKTTIDDTSKRKGGCWINTRGNCKNK